MDYLFFFIIFLALIIIPELTFRHLSVKKYGKKFKSQGKAQLSDYYSKYTGYPYLPYLLKSSNKNKGSDPEKSVRNTNLLKGSLIVNDYGLYDLCVRKDFIRDKTKKLVLIIGSSVVEGISWNSNQPFSISFLLSNHLEKKFPGEYQVLNCALSGWLSNEILIYYQLRFSEFNPDILVFYHGANDVLAALADNFRSDYAHYRRSIFEVRKKIYFRLILSSLFPEIKAYTLYEYLIKRAGLRFHPEYHLSRFLRPNEPSTRNLSLLDEHLDVEKRNISMLISSARQNRCKSIFLVSYIFWQKDLNSEWQGIQKKGVEIENRNLYDLAMENNVVFLDFAKSLDPSDEYFKDHQHFTYAGMNYFCEFLFQEIFHGSKNWFFDNLSG